MPGELLSVSVPETTAPLPGRTCVGSRLPFLNGLYLRWSCFSDVVLGRFALGPPQCYSHTEIGSFGVFGRCQSPVLHGLLL